MACPTCDHTMHGVGHGLYHCPRCGTLVGAYADGSAFAPALVGRVREYEKLVYSDATLIRHRQEWNQLGLAEAVRKPGDRP